MPGSSLGAAVTIDELDRDPHPTLAALRAAEPVSWVPALGGWLVTRYDLALEVMRDARTYTVQDERFSTAQVVGPSMLSLDGAEHDRHRAAFTPPLRPSAVRAHFTAAVEAECERLLATLAPRGVGDLRREFAGPLAAGVLTRTLGLDPGEAPAVLRWYREIVAAVTAITAGEPVPEKGRKAFAALGGRLREVIATGDATSLLVVAAGGAAPLDVDAVVANAAVFLFGGVDTTEGMLTNAALHLLGAPEVLARVRSSRAEGTAVDAAALDMLIEESLRLEPAAAVVDRYATRGVELNGVPIGAGDLVRVSLTATGRDPALFSDPDRLDLERARPRRHLAFAQGPHVCVGVHLARLEARLGLRWLLERLPGLALDPAWPPPAVRGLVFRKPDVLRVRWDRVTPSDRFGGAGAG